MQKIKFLQYCRWSQNGWAADWGCEQCDQVRIMCDTLRRKGSIILKKKILNAHYPFFEHVSQAHLTITGQARCTMEEAVEIVGSSDQSFLLESASFALKILMYYFPPKHSAKHPQVWAGKGYHGFRIGFVLTAIRAVRQGPYDRVSRNSDQIMLSRSI